MSDPTGSPPTRARRDALMVFLFVTLAVHFLAPSTPYAVGAFGDDGIYAALGQALARGAGYRSIFLAHSPVQLKYPPGFPLVLAVFWRLTGSIGGVAGLVSLANALLAGTAAALLWVFGRAVLRLGDGVLALFVVLPFFLEPALQYDRLVLSEPWLVAGWALALLLSARLADDGRSEASAVLPFAAVLGITTIFRSHALALVAAGAVAVALQRRRLRSVVLYCVTALAPEAAWLLTRARLAQVGPVSHAPDSLGYIPWALHTTLGPVALLTRSTIVSLRIYVALFERYLAPVPLVGLILLLLLVVAGLVGGYRVLRSQPFLPLGVAAFLALAIAWPFAQDRLVLPALPFVGLLAAESVAGLRRRAGHARALIAAAGLAAVALTGVQQVRIRRAAQQSLAPRPGRSSFGGPGAVLLNNTLFTIRVAGWTRAHTPSSAVVMVSRPAAVYLYAGRQGVEATPTQTVFAPSIYAVPGRHLATEILRDGVTVIIDSGRDPYLGRDLDTVHRSCPDVLRRVPGPAIRASLRAPAYLVDPDPACLRRFLARSSAQQGAG